MPDFEVFDKRAIPLTKRPMVTIQRKGPISLNRSAYHAIGEPEAVELLYDRAERIIGFRAVSRDTLHAYPVRPQGPKGGAPNTFLVAGNAFFAYYGVDVSTSRRYPAELVEGVLCVDLKNGGVEVTGNRGRRREAPAEEDSGGAGPV